MALPTRRSTRSLSVKPASKHVPAPPKAALRPHNGNTKKRSSPADPVPPPAKRTKNLDQNGLPSIPEKPIPQHKPLFIPLPTPPEKTRPCLQLFVWGAGNFGQFGMGSDVLGELGKPKKNTWVESKIPTDLFGENSGGIVNMAAGGLHTILVDEKGVVSIFRVK